MTFNDALTEIPVMFYVTLILLPVMIVSYFVVGRDKRSVRLSSASPEQMLLASRINVKRVLIINILLGAVLGLGLSLMIFITMISFDWYNNTGLFAVNLPYDTYPPAMVDAMPPQPPSYAKNQDASGSAADSNLNPSGDTNSQTNSGGN